MLSGSGSRPLRAPAFGRSLAPHEAALLKNMVTSIAGMLTERAVERPTDPLEEITGIRTGHSGPPGGVEHASAVARLHRTKVHGPARMSGSSTGALAACTEPAIIDAKTGCAR